MSSSSSSSSSPSKSSDGETKASESSKSETSDSEEAVGPVEDGGSIGISSSGTVATAVSVDVESEAFRNSALGGSRSSEGKRRRLTLKLVDDLGEKSSELASTSGIAERPPLKTESTTRKHTSRGSRLRDPARKRKKRRTAENEFVVESGDEEDRSFELTMASFDGRWRHSAGLGLFSVVCGVATFDSGLVLRITSSACGRFEVQGWFALPEKSTAEKIVWSNGQRLISWALEDDNRADFEAAAATAATETSPIGTKRRRTQVDYKALRAQIRKEEAAALERQCSSGGEESGAEEVRERAPRESSQDIAKQVEATLTLFRKWMLSTRTSHHEDRLRRKGTLSTTFPIRLSSGSAQHKLEKEMRVFPVQVAHRQQGVVLIITAAGRQRFKELNLDLWRTAPLPAPKQNDNFSTSGTGSLAANVTASVVDEVGGTYAAADAPDSPAPTPIAAPAAAVLPDLVAATPAVPTGGCPDRIGVGRKRLRRVVRDDDDEADKENGQDNVEFKDTLVVVTPVISEFVLSKPPVCAPVEAEADAKSLQQPAEEDGMTALVDGTISSRVDAESCVEALPTIVCGTAQVPTVALELEVPPPEFAEVDTNVVAPRAAFLDSPADMQVTVSGDGAANRAVMIAEVRPALTVEEVARRLDSDVLSSVEVKELLVFLGKTPVDTTTLARTKIGAIVAKSKKRLGSEAVIAAMAGDLVERWRRMWKQERDEREASAALAAAAAAAARASVS